MPAEQALSWVAIVTGKRVSYLRRTGWRVARRNFFLGKVGVKPLESKRDIIQNKICIKHDWKKPRASNN